MGIKERKFLKSGWNSNTNGEYAVSCRVSVRKAKRKKKRTLSAAQRNYPFLLKKFSVHSANAEYLMNSIIKTWTLRTCITV